VYVQNPSQLFVLAITSQNNQESEQSIHTSLTTARVSKERGRLAVRLALGDGTKLCWVMGRLRLGGDVAGCQ